LNLRPVHNPSGAGSHQERLGYIRSLAAHRPRHAGPPTSVTAASRHSFCQRSAKARRPPVRTVLRGNPFFLQAKDKALTSRSPITRMLDWSRCGSRALQRALSPEVEAEVHALMRISIDLIIEQANAWAGKGYPPNLIERAIELALGAAEAELRTTFTPEFSALIAAEIGQAVESQRKAQQDRR
jgi:hypothetical protein